MKSLYDAWTLASLRDGDVLTASTGSDFRFSGRAPVAFDLHWLRSVSGMLLGSTGLRVDAEASAELSLDLGAACLVSVRREDRDGKAWLRLTLVSDKAHSVASNFAVHATVPVPQSFDPLHLALIGQHPRQILRNVLKSLGGVAFGAFVQKSGIRSRQLASLANLWRTLTATTEPILWKAAEDPSQLALIADVTRWLANECPSACALCDHEPLTPLAADWIEALIGGQISTLLSDSGFCAARLAARNCLPLLVLPELPDLLRQILRALPGDSSEATPLSLDFARRLYDSAGATLARNISADFSFQFSAASNRKVFLDASFLMNEPGLKLYRQAVSGSLTALLSGPVPSVEVHDAHFTQCLLRRRTLEIHFPFLFSAAQSKELTSLAETEIVPGDSGRITVVRASSHSTITRETALLLDHTKRQSRMIIAATLSARDGEPVNDNYSLTFSETRTILPGAECQSYLQVLTAYGLRNVVLPAAPARATLTVTLPGSVVQDWTRVPLTRTQALAPILCRVSLVLQSTLRRLLPALYLADIQRYGTPSVVLPLLAYQCSQPFARVGLRQYSYDSMDPTSVVAALNSAAARLKSTLSRTQELLKTGGKTRLAEFYNAGSLASILRSVLQQRRLFASLLAADSFFIEQVLTLARYNRDLATTAIKDPGRSARDLQNFTRDFVTVFHRRLSRLYGGQDFTALGSLLLIEATAALFGRRDAIRASVTFQPFSNAGAPSIQTALDPAACPRSGAVPPEDRPQTLHKSGPPDA